MTLSSEDSQAPDAPQPERPQPLTVTETADLVRGIVEGRVAVIPSDHFKRRAKQRDFSTRDALEVFRTGTVRPVPIWNDKTETWNYDVAGQDIEGEALTVRIAPASEASVVLVTAF